MLYATILSNQDLLRGMRKTASKNWEISMELQVRMLVFEVEHKFSERSRTKSGPMFGSFCSLPILAVIVALLPKLFWFAFTHIQRH